jgi:lysozyme
MEFSLDFFEALRRMKARREAASAETPPPCPTPDADPAAHAQPLRIGPAGLALIKRFEGCARKRSDGCFEAYPDPGSGGDPWTIGWGATGKGIVKGTVWTLAECDARLEADLIRFAREVARAIGTSPTSQNQFDALVSFHYNTGAIARATLTRLHKEGRFAQAEAEFAKWVHASGKRLNGLVRRRAAEASLYADG